MVANKQAIVQTVIALVQNAPAVLILGLILVAVGLAMILSHNVWSGGAQPVLVTLVGWLTLIKGLLFLLLPPPAAVGFVLWGPTWEHFFYVDMALAFILGIYLTYKGFKSKSSLAT
jgi:hypothetical protein